LLCRGNGHKWAGEEMFELLTSFKKKPWIWLAFAIVLILAGAMKLSNQTSFETQTMKEDAKDIESQASGRTDITRIEIMFDESGPYWNGRKPITLPTVK